MYSKRSHSPGPLGNFSRGLTYHNYNNDLSNYVTPRNLSVQRVIDFDLGRLERSRSPIRDFSSPVSRNVSCLRSLPSSLTEDTSPILRRREMGFNSNAIDTLVSPVNSYSSDNYNFNVKPRSYYDFQSTANVSGRFNLYTPIKKPMRTDYSDYLRPSLQSRPVLRSGFVPRSRSERERNAMPIVRERKLIKFREISDDILNRAKRKVSWDIPEEISSPLIDELKNKTVATVEDSIGEALAAASDSTLKSFASREVLNRDSSLTMLEFKETTSTEYLSVTSDSPISVSRRSSDHDFDRMSPRNLLRLKSPRGSLASNASDTEDLNIPIKSLTPRRKSSESIHRTKKSRKPSIESMSMEDRNTNFCLIADKIRKDRESSETRKRFAESTGDSMSFVAQDGLGVTATPRKNSLSAQVDNESSVNKPRRFPRRRHRDNSTTEEKVPPNTRFRSRVRLEENSSHKGDKEKLEQDSPRSSYQMHRKSVKYKSNYPNHDLSKDSIDSELLEQCSSEKLVSNTSSLTKETKEIVENNIRYNTINKMLKSDEFVEKTSSKPPSKEIVNIKFEKEHPSKLIARKQSFQHTDEIGATKKIGKIADDELPLYSKDPNKKEKQNIENIDAIQISSVLPTASSIPSAKISKETVLSVKDSKLSTKTGQRQKVKPVSEKVLNSKMLNDSKFSNISQCTLKCTSVSKASNESLEITGPKNSKQIEESTSEICKNSIPTSIRHKEIDEVVVVCKLPLLKKNFSKKPADSDIENKSAPIDQNVAVSIVKKSSKTVILTEDEPGQSLTKSIIPTNDSFSSESNSSFNLSDIKNEIADKGIPSLKSQRLYKLPEKNGDQTAFKSKNQVSQSSTKIINSIQLKTIPDNNNAVISNCHSTNPLINLHQLKKPSEKPLQAVSDNNCHSSRIDIIAKDSIKASDHITSGTESVKKSETVSWIDHQQDTYSDSNILKTNNMKEVQQNCKSSQHLQSLNKPTNEISIIANTNQVSKIPNIFQKDSKFRKSTGAEKLKDNYKALSESKDTLSTLNSNIIEKAYKNEDKTLPNSKHVHKKTDFQNSQNFMGKVNSSGDMQNILSLNQFSKQRKVSEAEPVKIEKKTLTDHKVPQSNINKTSLEVPDLSKTLEEQRFSTVAVPESQNIFNTTLVQNQNIENDKTEKQPVNSAITHGESDKYYEGVENHTKSENGIVSQNASETKNLLRLTNEEVPSNKSTGYYSNQSKAPMSPHDNHIHLHLNVNEKTEKTSEDTKSIFPIPNATNIGVPKNNLRLKNQSTLTITFKEDNSPNGGKTHTELNSSEEVKLMPDSLEKLQENLRDTKMLMDFSDELKTCKKTVVVASAIDLGKRVNNEVKVCKISEVKERDTTLLLNKTTPKVKDIAKEPIKKEKLVINKSDSNLEGNKTSINESVPMLKIAEKVQSIKASEIQIPKSNKKVTEISSTADKLPIVLKINEETPKNDSVSENVQLPPVLDISMKKLKNAEKKDGKGQNMVEIPKVDKVVKELKKTDSTEIKFKNIDDKKKLEITSSNDKIIDENNKKLKKLPKETNEIMYSKQRLNTVEDKINNQEPLLLKSVDVPSQLTSKINSDESLGEKRRKSIKTREHLKVLKTPNETNKPIQVRNTNLKIFSTTNNQNGTKEVENKTCNEISKDALENKDKLSNVIKDGMQKSPSKPVCIENISKYTANEKLTNKSINANKTATQVKTQEKANSNDRDVSKILNEEKSNIQICDHIAHEQNLQNVSVDKNSKMKVFQNSKHDQKNSTNSKEILNKSKPTEMDKGECATIKQENVDKKKPQNLLTNLTNLEPGNEIKLDNKIFKPQARNDRLSKIQLNDKVTKSSTVEKHQLKKETTVCRESALLNEQGNATKILQQSEIFKHGVQVGCNVIEKSESQKMNKSIQNTVGRDNERPIKDVPNENENLNKLKSFSYANLAMVDKLSQDTFNTKEVSPAKSSIPKNLANNELHLKCKEKIPTQVHSSFLTNSEKSTNLMLDNEPHQLSNTCNTSDLKSKHVNLINKSPPQNKNSCEISSTLKTNDCKKPPPRAFGLKYKHNFDTSKISTASESSDSTESSSSSSENEDDDSKSAISYSPRTIPLNTCRSPSRSIQSRISNASAISNSTISNSTITTHLSETQSPDKDKVTQKLRFRKYNIDDFVFLKLLGKGSFGKVLLAELKGHELYFAIKCLKKDVVLEDDDVESTMIERRVLALGTQHPYMCKLYCTFQTKSYLFFVMEYLNGGDLMFHIQENRPFDVNRAMFYGAEIVSALKFLHKRGIVYRDIKLDNVMLDGEGHIRLVDFGMCECRVYREEYMPFNFCGTPNYIAPEIVLGQRYNQSVDWWSFGVLLFEMVAGRSPFVGTDEDELFWSICNEEPLYPRFLPEVAKDILENLLVKTPSQRLGMPSSPAGEITDHPFFSTIDWVKLEKKQIPPPFKPTVLFASDTNNFDRSFTSDAATLSPVDSKMLESMDQEQFQGFSYTNPHITG